jgi:ABC-type transport system substrate-binding protein
LKSNKSIVVEEKAGPGVYFLYFNINKEPFNDVRVRRAIQYAINKDQIAQVILGNVAVKAINMIPPMAFAYTDKVMRYDYSPDEAKKLLKAAGLANGFRTKLNFSNLSPWPAIVPVIQENLKQVNIDVELVGGEHGTHMANIRAKKFDFAVHPHLRPPDPDEIFSDVFHSKGPVNGSGYSQIDKEIERAKAETSSEKRKSMYVELQKKIMEDSPAIPLFYLKIVVARKPYVKNHPIDILNGFRGYQTYIQQ